jgi:hypothetical protein
MKATPAVDNWADGTQAFIDKPARTIDVFSEDLDDKYGPGQSDDYGVGWVGVTGRGYAMVRVYEELDPPDTLVCSSLISLSAALRLVELADWDVQYQKAGFPVGHRRRSVSAGFSLGITHEARVGVVDHGTYQTIWTVDAIELGNVLRHFLTED